MATFHSIVDIKACFVFRFQSEFDEMQWSTVQCFFLFLSKNGMKEALRHANPELAARSLLGTSWSFTTLWLTLFKLRGYLKMSQARFMPIHWPYVWLISFEWLLSTKSPPCLIIEKNVLTWSVTSSVNFKWNYKHFPECSCTALLNTVFRLISGPVV